MHIARLSERCTFGLGSIGKRRSLVKFPRIRGFAVEMTLRERVRLAVRDEFLRRSRSLETRTEHGFPHSHSDGFFGGPI